MIKIYFKKLCRHVLTLFISNSLSTCCMRCNFIVWFFSNHLLIDSSPNSLERFRPLPLRVIVARKRYSDTFRSICSVHRRWLGRTKHAFPPLPTEHEENENILVDAEVRKFDVGHKNCVCGFLFTVLLWPCDQVWYTEKRRWTSTEKEKKGWHSIRGEGKLRVDVGRRFYLSFRDKKTADSLAHAPCLLIPTSE